jgi:hypothetical protein
VGCYIWAVFGWPLLWTIALALLSAFAFYKGKDLLTPLRKEKEEISKT